MEMGRWRWGDGDGAMEMGRWRWGDGEMGRLGRGDEDRVIKSEVECAFYKCIVPRGTIFCHGG